MKRSEKIALGAVGLLAVAAFWPSSGTKSEPDSENVVAYKTRDDCRKAAVLTAEQCDTEFGKAETAAIASAPKHTSQASCESQYGIANCRQTSWGGASVFVPLMTGIMVANYLNSGARAAQPVFPGTGMQRADCANPALAAARPECAARQTSSTSGSTRSSGSWGFSTSHGSTHSADTSAASKGVSVPSSAVTGRSTTSVSSRGGFGSSSAAHSSSGS